MKYDHSHWCCTRAPLQHCVILADDGHIALIEVAERTIYRPPLQLFPLVDSFLKVVDAPGVFVVGDAASVMQKGHPVPGVAQAAIQEGRYVGRLIAARPARSVLVPSIFGIGDAATPAVHTTVALGILFPPAITPLSSTCLDRDSGHDLHAELREPLGRPA